MEHIPLVDLKAQHAAVADDVAAGFASVLERTAFVLGDEVDAFEREFAEFSGAPHCVGVGNGTDAVDGAMKLARLFTRKNGFISSLGGFHGKSIGALSVMGKSNYRSAFEPLLPEMQGKFRVGWLSHQPVRVTSGLLELGL